MSTNHIVITPKHLASARAAWEAEHPGESWDMLRTQTKNRLAKEEYFHEVYHDLCDQITGRTNGTEAADA